MQILTLLLKDDHLVKKAHISVIPAHPTRFCNSLSLRLNRKVRLHMHVCARVWAWVSKHAHHPNLPLNNRRHIKDSALLYSSDYWALSYIYIYILVRPNARKITQWGNKIRGEVWWFGGQNHYCFYTCCMRDLTTISSLKYSGINYITEV